MINIFMKIDDSALKNAFSLKCYSCLISLFSEFIKFGKNNITNKIDTLFNQTVKLLTFGIEKPI